MKIVLREDVERLGRKGAVVNVAEGYARNFLLPKKMAFQAGNVDLEALKRSTAREQKRKEEEKKNIEGLAQKIKNLSLTLSMKAGGDDKLYGSVSEQEILEALKKEGVVIDKKKIVLKEPIKLLGVYNVPLRLSEEISVSLKVWVVKE